jgi:hypothetical protein
LGFLLADHESIVALAQVNLNEVSELLAFGYEPLGDWIKHQNVEGTYRKSRPREHGIQSRISLLAKRSELSNRREPSLRQVLMIALREKKRLVW